MERKTLVVRVGLIYLKEIAIVKRFLGNERSLKEGIIKLYQELIYHFLVVRTQESGSKNIKNFSRCIYPIHQYVEIASIYIKGRAYKI